MGGPHSNAAIEPVMEFKCSIPAGRNSGREPEAVHMLRGKPEQPNADLTKLVSLFVGFERSNLGIIGALDQLDRSISVVEYPGGSIGIAHLASRIPMNVSSDSDRTVVVNWIDYGHLTFDNCSPDAEHVAVLIF